MDNLKKDDKNPKQDKIISILLNLAFYSMLLLLIGILVYPHTMFFYQKNIYPPFTMRLNKNDIVLQKGKSEKLHMIAINKRVEYSSTDFKVADVYFNGKVVGRKVGKAVIKAKVGEKTYKCMVKVIDINKDKMTLKVGQSKKLKVKGTFSPVKWVSADSPVAKVNRFGKVTGVKKGKTTITGKVKGTMLTCKVTVK